MKIVIDSSVLNGRSDDTEKSLEITLSYMFLNDIRAQSYTICLPNVIEFEFDRMQEEKALKKRIEIESAKSILVGHGLTVSGTEETHTYSLKDFFVSRGIQYEAVTPALEHFEEALRRCAYHLVPTHKQGKEDQMRDAIIWLLALETARNCSDGAILVSNDPVHSAFLNESTPEANEQREEAQSAKLNVFSHTRKAACHSNPRLQQYLEYIHKNWGKARFMNSTLPEYLAITKYVDFFALNDRVYVSLLIRDVEGMTVFQFDTSHSPTIQNIYSPVINLNMLLDRERVHSASYDAEKRDLEILIGGRLE